MKVVVVYCPAPGHTDLVTLDVPSGTTVADALQQSGLLQRHRLDANALRVGIWSKPCEPTAALREQDRVEIYRPLQVDPMEARRLRQQHQGASKPARKRISGSPS